MFLNFLIFFLISLNHICNFTVLNTEFYCEFSHELHFHVPLITNNMKIEIIFPIKKLVC